MFIHYAPFGKITCYLSLCSLKRKQWRADNPETNRLLLSTISAHNFGGLFELLSLGGRTSDSERHRAATIFKQKHKHPDASINSGYLYLGDDETFHRPSRSTFSGEQRRKQFVFVYLSTLQEIDSLRSQKTASVLRNKVERAASQNFQAYFPRTSQNTDVKESVKEIIVKWLPLPEHLLRIASNIMGENAAV